MLAPSAAWETGRGAFDGWMEEPSVVRAADGTWMLFYSSGYTECLDYIGVGLATGPTPVGPWTRYEPAPTAATVTNGDFEGGGGGVLNGVVNAGVANGWSLDSNTVVAPTPTLDADAHSGTKCQRIVYSPQAGDAGKYIWLRRAVDTPALLRNDTLVYTLWHKGSGGGHTVYTNPVVSVSGRTPLLADCDFTPGAEWAQFVPDPGLYCHDATTGTSVVFRVIRIDLTADTGDIDIKIDDAALTYGIREPIKRGIIRSNVQKVGSTYYMVGATGGNIILSSSADGIRWGTDTIILSGAAGQWDAAPNNSRLFQDDDGMWYLYYEAAPGNKIGVASAPAITGPYTRYAGNPLMDGVIGGRPCVYRRGAVYYMYYHTNVPGVTGTSISRASGTTPFDFVGDQDPVIHRVGADEGEGLNVGHMNDPYVFNDGSRWIMYYDVNVSGVSLYPSHIKAVTAPIALDAGELPPPSMAVASLVDVAMFSGDTTPLLLTMPCDLSGCSATWGLATAPGRTLIASHGVNVLDAGAGTIAAPVAAVDTSGLAGYYYYEVQVTDRVSDVRTLLHGRLLIRPDVVT